MLLKSGAPRTTLCQPTPSKAPPSANLWAIWGKALTIESNRRPGGDPTPEPHRRDPGDGLPPFLHRRLEVAVCWALARRAVLDSRELYEESFALSEEFREWLLCLEDHPEILQANLLMVPRSLDPTKRPETDGLLEI